MIGRLPGREAYDAERRTVTWRGWYKLARWKKLRLVIFARDLFTCQCGCGVIEGDTSKLVCDHKRPHRGDERLFWDPANLQTLLKTCHDGWKQRQERREA
ncbi:MAG: HNH endonuclease [Zymomonas sp.]|nr:MAG: HNH endonuclease [Zymomonas sp.]